MSKIEEIKILSESVNPNFLKDSHELLQYFTSKNIEKYINQNRVLSIIGNPPITLQ